jgi:tRNA/tmRNA/rRNA uracil-C5-methylase (TrmA/RlmC/RlmD family)
VIEELALHRPARAVHIFCNPDLLGGELSRWQGAGYDAVRGVPFDMFPGTSDIELMVLLEPSL